MVLYFLEKSVVVSSDIGELELNLLGFWHFCLHIACSFVLLNRMLCSYSSSLHGFLFMFGIVYGFEENLLILSVCIVLDSVYSLHYVFFLLHVEHCFFMLG